MLLKVIADAFLIIFIIIFIYTLLSSEKKKMLKLQRHNNPQPITQVRDHSLTHTPNQ